MGSSSSDIIQVQHLFRPLDEALHELLGSLGANEWELATVAGSWCVKDVAAHLLDGNIRALSLQRDKYFGEQPPEVEGYRDLVNWLNDLNAHWVRAMNRISPSVMRMLHAFTGPPTCDYFESLDPMEQAIFAVDWAGEDKSLNWMHLAREYTEKWHHQQQIRDATGREGMISPTYFYPLMDTYMRALPYTFRDVEATRGTLILVRVTDLGDWYLERDVDSWRLTHGSHVKPVSSIVLAGEFAWKLFSRNIRPDQVEDKVSLEGDERMARKVLTMVSVMA